MTVRTKTVTQAQEYNMMDHSKRKYVWGVALVGILFCLFVFISNSIGEEVVPLTGAVDAKTNEVVEQGIMNAAVEPQESAPAKLVDPNATIENGKKVKFDYTLKVEGQEVETSIGKEPLEYTQGEGKIIPGLEKALEGMKVGEQKTVKVSPEDGYGQPNAEAKKDFPKSTFPADFNPEKGTVIEMQDPEGNVMPGQISEIKADGSVTIDFNHPLAGKTLEFDVKIVGIE